MCRTRDSWERYSLLFSGQGAFKRSSAFLQFGKRFGSGKDHHDAEFLKFPWFLTFIKTKMGLGINHVLPIRNIELTRFLQNANQESGISV